MADQNKEPDRNIAPVSSRGDAIEQLPQDVLDTLSPEIINALNGAPNNLALLKIVSTSMQMTRGLYPPPMMMEEYQKIDPAINAQILEEARKQSAHRRELEKLATERSERRLDAAQSGQQVIAVLSLIAAVLIILVPLFLGVEISWLIALSAILLAAVGVGGKPAATVLTTYIARKFPGE